jgi:hypothetical protein
VALARPELLTRRRLLADMSAAAAIVAAVFAPLAVVYFRVQREHGFSRTTTELAQYSAQLLDYLRVPAGGFSWGGLLSQGLPERELFPGFAVLTLAAVGVSSIFYARGAPPPRAGHAAIVCLGTARSALGLGRGIPGMVATYALVAIWTLWLSTGPGFLKPYGLLLRVLPGLSGLRVPARLATMVIMALVVLASVGAAHVLQRLSRRTAAAVAVIVALVVLLEGQHGNGPVDALAPEQRKLDAAAYAWLRTSPPGAVLELNITSQDDLHAFTLLYQLNTLRHGHPIVNGYSGWPAALQEFLGGPSSPFAEPGQTADTLAGLRAIGVRYLLLHTRTYADASYADRVLAEIRAATDQRGEERQFRGTFAWELPAGATDGESGPPPALRRIDSTSFDAAASRNPDRLALAFDGDIETRWLSGERQTGSEWIEFRLNQPLDVGRVRIENSPWGWADYPRRLIVESTDDTGTSRVLFDGTVLAQLVQSLATTERAIVELNLPPNRTRTLRLRQGGTTRTWFWSMNELGLYARSGDASSGR